MSCTPLTYFCAQISSAWPIAMAAAVFVISAALAGSIIYTVIIKSKKGTVSDANNTQTPEKISDSDYSIITDRILQIEGRYKTILFAAAGYDCLPVTIPVNVAIHLARNGRKCLLVDLDQKRNAIAGAFAVEPAGNGAELKQKPLATPIRNLSLWPAHNFTITKQMNIRPLIQTWNDGFDFIVINAPYFDASPDRSHIASAAQCCFLFTRNTRQTARLAALMTDAGCKLIGNLQITQNFP